jgi:hypothetical protein
MTEELIRRYQYLLKTVNHVPYLWNSLEEWREETRKKINLIKSKIK